MGITYAVDPESGYPEAILRSRTVTFMVTYDVAERVLRENFPGVPFSFQADNIEAARTAATFEVIADVEQATSVYIDVDDLAAAETGTLSPEGGWTEYLCVLARRGVIPEGIYVVEWI